MTMGGLRFMRVHRQVMWRVEVAKILSGMEHEEVKIILDD
jgi:hypothetical protein